MNRYYQCSSKVAGMTNEDNMTPHIQRVGLNAEDLVTNNVPAQNMWPLTEADKDNLRELIRETPFNHNEARRLLEFGYKTSINRAFRNHPRNYLTRVFLKNKLMNLL